MRRGSVWEYSADESSRKETFNDEAEVKVNHEIDAVKSKKKSSAEGIGWMKGRTGAAESRRNGNIERHFAISWFRRLRGWHRMESDAQSDGFASFAENLGRNHRVRLRVVFCRRLNHKFARNLREQIFGLEKIGVGRGIASWTSHSNGVGESADGNTVRAGAWVKSKRSSEVAGATNILTRLNDTEKGARCQRLPEFKRIPQQHSFGGLGGGWSRADGDCGRIRARIEKTAQGAIKRPARNQVLDRGSVTGWRRSGAEEAGARRSRGVAICEFDQRRVLDNDRDGWLVAAAANVRRIGEKQGRSADRGEGGKRGRWGK
ncbi:hypothetical protein B0H17DRAFT_1177664 [Mycena rosella]|uniref:Uncharacterized protein n=1 Tax=Mycena rosella TaxID=1033263 RepID=A0AAD7GJC3_MYCRO|nr:hypothetical protein B0H17DRAFT_1177664 [Mycena rosella]